MSTTKRLETTLREYAARFRVKTYQGPRSPWIFHHTFATRGKQPSQRVDSIRRSLASAADRAKLPDRWRPPRPPSPPGPDLAGRRQEPGQGP